MDPRQRFRATDRLRITDAHAAKKPLSSGDRQADKARTEDIADQIAQLQNILYAEHKRKLLVILQGMDTSGKDGTIKGVFGKIDPLGIQTVGFRAPTPVEREHDFLWRIHQRVPAQGEIVIFNRSHYEDVVTTGVHGWTDDSECTRRYAHIRDFEQMLAETGTVLLKFFLHISKDEQQKRLQARIDNPEKHWKFDMQDLEARKHWKAYQRAYQLAILQTDADHAPWYVIPADSKSHRNLAVADIVLKTMQEMNLAFPPANPALANMAIS